MSRHFAFNQNRQCEFFPCHKGVEEDVFNCLFCYCPLYALGAQCGGDMVYTDGVKDCSHCTRPHDENGYDFIMEHIGRVIDLGSR